MDIHLKRNKIAIKYGIKNLNLGFLNGLYKIKLNWNSPFIN